MLTTLVLVCAAAIAPADCTPTTALDRLRMPAHGAAICGLGAQTMLAPSILAPAPGQYVKIVCARAAR